MRHKTGQLALKPHDLINLLPPPIRMTAPCPLCGGPLEIRRCPIGHRRRILCRCGYRAKLPEPIRMALAGAPMLPGFEAL